MIKLLVGLMLTLVSSGAMAEWTYLTKSNSEGVITVYVKPSSVRKNGDMVKMWSMYDFKKAKVFGKEKPYLSFKQQQEFDCKEERFRFFSIIYMGGHMGEGKVLSSDSTVDDWQPIAPDTVIETLWETACGKQ